MILNGKRLALFLKNKATMTNGFSFVACGYPGEGEPWLLDQTASDSLRSR